MSHRDISRVYGEGARAFTLFTRLFLQEQVEDIKQKGASDRRGRPEFVFLTLAHSLRLFSDKKVPGKEAHVKY